MDFSGKTIALAVTGGIAAYKACDLIRELYRRGAQRVVCIMTPSAEAFISPLTLQALSRQPVHTSELAVDNQGTPVHITLAQQADALVILPATTNVIARLSYGMADDLVTTTAITFTGKPVIIAPAMNTRMWQHPLTIENVARLKRLPNVTIVEPASGHLACGETGEGHLAPQETVLQAIYQAVHEQAGLFRGVKAIVTAGGTSEAIDPVRMITNRSSGKMGLALADELAAMGAEVTLVTTRPPEGRVYEVLPVATALEMKAAVEERFAEADLLVMAAAVSDFAVENPSAQKIKRSENAPATLSLTPNPDILAGLGEWKRAGQVLVGFAAESEELMKNAHDKLRRKNLDLIVANDISRADIGFETEENEVTLLSGKPDSVPQILKRAPKSEIAREILLRVRPLLQTEPLPAGV